MANVRSQLITNQIATPVVLSPVGQAHGRTRRKICKLTFGAGDAIGMVYRLCLIRAHDRIISIGNVRNVDTAATTMSIGVRTPSKDTTDPAQISAGVDAGFVSATPYVTVQPVQIEMLGLGKTTIAAQMGNPVWQMAVAAATEPAQGTEYEIVAIRAGAVALAGSHTFVIAYLAND